jgi:hypothetical protein
MVNAKLIVTGLKEVEAKAAAADVRILAQNKLMVQAMLDYIKPIVISETPLGPGHFGYHLRDMFTTEVKFEGIKTVGFLKSPPTGYWREFGTQGHMTRGRSIKHYVAAISGQMGERAFMTAHKAATGVKKFINFYYGGLAAWWRA